MIGLPEARPLPSTIGGILESHPATLIADAEMYRATLEEAAEALGFGVVLYPRRSEFDEAARALEVDAARLGELLTGMGRELGPPWRKDHRIAAASAIAALGEDGGLAGALG